MAVFRRRRSLVCREAIALMSDYLEGALSSRDRTRLEVHLGDCPHCSEYLAQLQVAIASLGRTSADDLSDDLSDEAVDDLVALYLRWRAS